MLGQEVGRKVASFLAHLNDHGAGPRNARRSESSAEAEISALTTFSWQQEEKKTIFLVFVVPPGC